MGPGCSIRLPLWCSLVVGLALGRLAGAQSMYEGGETFPLEGPAAGLLVDDFDLDGRLDTVLSLPASRQVKVYLGGAGDLFRPPAAYEVGFNPVFIMSGDLNGDGAPDLAVVNSGSSTFSVLLNRGDGSFVVARHVEVGLGPRVGELADFDRDGNLDAATSNLASRDVKVVLGDGTGDFQPSADLEVGDNPHSLVAADFDGDDLPDVVVAHRDDAFTTGAVSWFRGVGDGTFEPARETDLMQVDTVPRFVAAGDLDRDGRIDLIVLGNGGELLFLKNLGPGEFDVRLIGEESSQSGDFFRGFLLVADYDGDGELDITTPLERRGEKGMRVYLGSGDGNFREPQDFFLGPDPASLALADLDRDGLLDAVLTWNEAPEFTVFRGTGPGRLATRTTVPLDDGPRGVIAIDGNRDGNADFLTMMTDALHLITGDGVGGFGAPRVQEFSFRSFQDLVAADFDRDGNPDLALSDFTGDEILLGFLDEDGLVVRTEELAVNPLPSLLVYQDFDGDRWNDLAVTHEGLSTVTLLLRPGAPEPRILEAPAGSRPTALTTGDVDRDGFPDLVVGTRDHIRILFGDGQGEFPRAQTVEGARSASALRLADLDEDGATDLVVAARRSIVLVLGVVGEARHEEIDPGGEILPLEVHDVDRDGHLDLVAATPAAVVVSRGLGDGSFDPPESYPVGTQPTSLALADVDSDGRRDCVTANFGSWSLSVLHGKGEATLRTFRRGDVDGDGRPTLSDAVVILERLFRGGSPLGCPDAGDTDDSGELNLTDAVSLLLYLFLGGPPPPLPGPDACGEDNTTDDLGVCGVPCL